MATEFVRWGPADTDALIELLTGDEWPFHAAGRPTAETVRDRVAAGFYDGPDTRTFWLVADGTRVGFVRLFDLGDDTPCFDLRVRAAHRGRGLGAKAVRWLTDHVFAEFPTAHRIEATTRADNWAMRRVLDTCGYQQEAHYRQSWPAPDGTRHDGTGYSSLRTEWSGGRESRTSV